MEIRPPRWAFLVVSVALALILIWAFRGNRVPIVSDEIGYISIAKYLLAGAKITLSVMPSYRFGMAFILAPIFALPVSDQTAYQLVVVVNCVQTALIPLVLIGIAKRIGFESSWRVCVAAVLAALFPSYLYQVALAWPEVTFRLWFLIVVYLVASAWATRKALFWYLAAIACVWLYSLHGRAVGLFPAFLVVVYFGYKKGRLSLLNTICVVAVTAVLVVAAWRFQKHLEMELWGSPASEIKRGVEHLLSSNGPRGFVTALMGQAWSQVAASFGLILIGVVASWKISMRNPSVMPALIFALIASGIGAVASAVQLATLNRVDHLIYSRYNDGFTTLYVWLGVWAVMTATTPLKRLGLAIGIFAAGLGALALIGAPPGISGMVTPTIPAFLWVDYLVPLQTASAFQIIAIASLAAVAVGALLCLRPGIIAVAIIVIAVGASDLVVKRSAWGAHYAREYVVDQNTKQYAKVGRPIYWDQSAISDLNIMFDQYSAIGSAMPISNLATADIPAGTAAIVALDFRKSGYSCVSHLQYNAKLVQRSAQPGSC